MSLLSCLLAVPTCSTSRGSYNFFLPLGTEKEPIYFFVSLEGYCWGMFVSFDFEGVLLNDLALFLLAL